MPISLYAATIPSLRQVTAAVGGLLDKAADHCGGDAARETELIEARLAPDMLPFGWQVKSVAGHSIGAVEGVFAGKYSPDRSPSPGTLAGLKELIAKAVADLDAIDPASIEAVIGRDMLFEFGERRMEFTADEFLLTFAQPNFYFHATTVYAILRMKGMEIGKRDFMGAMRMKH